MYSIERYSTSTKQFAGKAYFYTVIRILQAVLVATQYERSDLEE